MRPQLTRVGTSKGRQELLLLWFLVTRLPDEVLPACTPLCIFLHLGSVVTGHLSLISGPLSYVSLKCQQPAKCGLPSECRRHFSQPLT